MFKSKGVTLVELSIVLAILGILIVATISGKSLIDISRATATIQQLSDRSLAFQIFSTTYDCLPGDCANTKVVGTSGGLVTTGVGDGDGKVEGYGGTAPNLNPNEIAYVEEHLKKADLFTRSIGSSIAATGTSATQTNGTNNILTEILPLSKIPNAYIAAMTIGTLGTYSIIGTAVKTDLVNGTPSTSVTILKMIDQKLDDSVGTTGDTRCLSTLTIGTVDFANHQAYTSSSCVLAQKINM